MINNEYILQTLLSKTGKIIFRWKNKSDIGNGVLEITDDQF